LEEMLARVEGHRIIPLQFEFKKFEPARSPD
jgi:hypothetical protein